MTVKTIPAEGGKKGEREMYKTADPQKSYMRSIQMNQWWVLQCQTKNVVSPALTAPCAWLPEVASKPDLSQRIRSHLKREWERVVPQAPAPATAAVTTLQ